MAKRTILVTTSEKKRRESYQNGFERGKIEGRKEAFAELRMFLGIDEVICQAKSEIEDEITERERYSGCMCCGR